MDDKDKRSVGLLGFLAIAVLAYACNSATKDGSDSQSDHDPPGFPSSGAAATKAQPPNPVVVPEATGQNAEKVRADLQQLAMERGFHFYASVNSAYSNAAEASNTFETCGSDPAPGTPVDDSVRVVRLYGVPPGLPCPAVDYTSLRGGNLPQLPDSDSDFEPDYKDPYPFDRDRNTLFPDGDPDYGGSRGSESGGGADNHRHSHHKEHHHHHGGMCNKKWWC